MRFISILNTLWQYAFSAAAAAGFRLPSRFLNCSIDCISKENGFSYLWNLHKTNYDEADYKYDGPVTYAYNARHEIRPYGIFLLKAGMAESDTLLFKFNRKEL